MPDRWGNASGSCPHGLVGACPDCPPQGRVVGQSFGPRAARVRGREVWRYREDGSFDWVTTHLTKRAARRAADLYERTGEVRGPRP